MSNAFASYASVRCGEHRAALGAPSLLPGSREELFATALSNSCWSSSCFVGRLPMRFIRSALFVHVIRSTTRLVV